MKDNIIPTTNSILVSLYFLNVIVGSVSAISSVVLLISIFYLALNYKLLKEVDFKILIWPACMIIYGIYFAYIDFFFMGEYSNSIEKKLKFIGGGVFFIYLSISKINKKVFDIGVLLGGFVLILSVVYEGYVNSFIGRVGLGHNPIVLGWIMVVYSVCLFIISFATKNSYLYLIVGFIVLLLSALTGTRGLYPIYLLIMCVLILIYVRNKKSHSEISIKYIALIFLISFSTLIVVKDPVVNRLNQTWSEYKKVEVGDLSSSIGQRVQMYNSAIYLAKNAPVLGHGPDLENINNKLQNYLDENNYRTDLMDNYSHFHNEYLNALVSYGLIGLFLYLLILITPLYGLNGLARYMMISLMSVYVIGSLFDSPFYSNRSTSTFLFIVPVIMFYCLEYFKEDLSDGIDKNIREI